MTLSAQLKSDHVGAMSSILCIIHCIVTPFVFFTIADKTTHGHDAPFWWKTIDYLFLFISLIAVVFTVRNSTSSWIKTALPFFWLLLMAAIVNEKFELTHLGEWAVYTPAIGLTALHLVNKRYCVCSEECCKN